MKGPTLFVFGGGIGDFILTWPALRQLSSDGPVDLLGDRERLQLALGGSLARAAYTFEETDFHTIFSEPSPRLRDFLAHYERAIVWLGSEGDLSKGLEDLGLRSVLCHPGKPPPDWTRHASVYYCECLGIPDPGPVQISVTARAPACDLVIHPGSGLAPLDRGPRRDEV